MLEVVDPERRGFAETDRAQVARHFRSARMRGGDRRAEHRRRQVVVRLEVVDALVEPEVHRLRRILRARQRVHLRRERAFAFEVRARHVHLGSGGLARLDPLAHFEIRVRLDRPGRADRRHTAREVETREAERHLGEGPASGRIEEVVVHPDEPREHGAAVQVENLRILRHVRRVGLLDRTDHALLQDDRLVLASGSPGAIDDADVRQRDDRRIDLHVGLRLGNEDGSEGEEVHEGDPCSSRARSYRRGSRFVYARMQAAERRGRQAVRRTP